ncbi:MAG: hypothetical protein AB1432_06220 [Bacteroidota bacterium]
MTHISDFDLELYLLKGAEISESEKDSIQRHLSVCTVCTENFYKLKEFYGFIESNIDSEEKEDELLANKILGINAVYDGTKLLNEHNRAVKVYDGKYEIIEAKKDSLISRAVELIRVYPYRFSGSLALIGMIIAFFIMLKKPDIKTINPTLAVIKDNILSVYNEMGDLMWKKGVPGMVDYRTDKLYENQKDFSDTRELLLDDLENDGINELLLTGNFDYLSTFARDTLYCFDPYGKLIWKYGCGEFKSLNTPRWKHSFWFIPNYFTVDTKEGKKLFVIASTNYAPTKLFELDFNTGKIKQEFYNSGGITATKLFDIDNDGYEEIIIGGINNAFSSAFIAVFEPENVNGFSPSTEIFIPDSLQQNSALKYIIFPTSSYNKAVSKTDYNEVEQFLVSREEKTITVYIQEAPSGTRDDDAAVLYNFDINWQLNSVVLGDNFIAEYSRLLVDGKVKEPLDSNYSKKLAEGVRHLK